MNSRPPILLFDGDCSFCNRSVQWIMRRERESNLYFVPLKSELARSLVGTDRISRADSVLFLHPDGRVLDRSDASAATLHAMGYPKTAWWFSRIPRFVRDAGYRLVAANRHRIPGRKQCGLPDPKCRPRIIESMDNLWESTGV